MAYLSCEIVETQPTVDASVIWLHGLGASGHDFVPIVPELRIPQNRGIRFVFPHAPSIPITVNGGTVMPGWYDILALDTEREVDTQQLMVSAKAVIALVEREISRGIASERVVLAGFSQGGAVIYQAGLSYGRPLAGLMAMSTYFATHKTIEPVEANQSTPIYISHGTRDPMVPEAMGKHALAVLKSLGHDPLYKTYPMEHEIHPQQVRDISEWLLQTLT
jgi:phospholipase/carboxylesterase